MTTRLLTFAVVLTAGALYADSADEQKLLGTWVVQGNAGDEATSWVFEEKADGSLKVVRMQGSEKLAEYECGTHGRDCEFKDSGKKAKVSMWFNGPKLVQLETKGDQRIRRRFSVKDPSDLMEVESTRVSSGGKPETATFKRVQVTAKQ